jgi:hypothetical protein
MPHPKLSHKIEYMWGLLIKDGWLGLDIYVKPYHELGYVPFGKDAFDEEKCRDRFFNLKVNNRDFFNRKKVDDEYKAFWHEHKDNVRFAYYSAGIFENAQNSWDPSLLNLPNLNGWRTILGNSFLTSKEFDGMLNEFSTDCKARTVFFPAVMTHGKIYIKFLLNIF